jgi:hypothetical protein
MIAELKKLWYTKQPDTRALDVVICIDRLLPVCYIVAAVNDFCIRLLMTLSACDVSRWTVIDERDRENSH